MNAVPRILLTRPEASNAQLRAELEGMGYAVSSAPMLEIKHYDAAHPPSPQGYQAILMTSANAAPALRALGAPADFPVLAVGDASARAAQRHGMGNVTSAGGDSADLYKMLAARFTPDKGALLYLRGRDISIDMAAVLQESGFRVDEWIAYTAEPVQAMPAPADRRDKLAAYDAVLFFSGRTARHFAKLVRGIHAEDGLQHTQALCISRKLVSCIHDLPWGGVHVARRPDRDSMIALALSCVPVN